ncbi:1,5-anhydro-D-fructose reductase [Rubripirellula obstinata]|uniref:1,5-anhydro-D-fructose reductase n=1 Tax=Rubripirellula obstinata TaxID=406547 RepID=A0A5B1CE79_9BACT|nr:Gfo/Idh/MocA family oxidoreductase [Rubripirellula obstinata]KAA1258886.1 1,5-anhydro-D-fructose reductase [Rubripirellula obstinata]
MTKTTTRFGIIGTGRITRRLVADLQSTDHVAVTAIASRDAERARWYADQYGIENAVNGYDQLLARDDVDAVYVSLPPSMHAEWSIAAAESGRHVLCEKPLAMNLEQAKQIDTACRTHQVRWLDATGWLHHERSRAFEVWLLEQKFGKIGHISASVSFYEPFQSGDHRLDRSLGGGCLLDLAWYAGGLIVFASIDDLPISVQATAVMRGDVPIRVTALIKLSDDISATLSCGYDTATRKWFEIAGSKSSLICDDFTRPWTERPTRCWIHDSTGSVESHTFEGNQERNMIERLIGDEDLTPLHQQALQTQALLDAIDRSLQQGGQSVEVEGV